MRMTTIQDTRQRAWRTRRARYGAKGHAGTYSRSHAARTALDTARTMLARLHVEEVLSEGQASKGCSMNRVQFRKLVDRQHPDYPERRLYLRAEFAKSLRLFRTMARARRERSEAMTPEDWDKYIDEAEKMMAEPIGRRRGKSNRINPG